LLEVQWQQALGNFTIENLTANRLLARHALHVRIKKEKEALQIGEAI
jgi:hypothetical protein